MTVVIDGATQQSPTTRTFSTLKTEVARFVMGPDDTEVLAVAGAAINTAIRKLNLKKWHWLRTYSDITLTAGTSDYALPSNFRAVLHMQRLNAAGQPDGTIRFNRAKTLDLEHPSATTSGDPGLYTVYNYLDTFAVSLEVNPSAGFVARFPALRLRYFAKTDVLSNDQDQPFVPSEVEEWIIWHACIKAAAQFDPEKIGIARQEAADLWRLMIRDNSDHDESDDWSE